MAFLSNERKIERYTKVEKCRDYDTLKILMER